MARVDNVIDIRAPREKVFEFITDPATKSEWVKWAKKVEVTSPDKGVGQTESMVMLVGPSRQRVEGIVTEYKPGEVITWRTTKGMEMTERLALVGTTDGTKLAWSLDYTPPMGPMGKLLDFLFMAKLLDQLMEDSLDILKERLESK